jgi:hypothetical protein
VLEIRAQYACVHRVLGRPEKYKAVLVGRKLGGVPQLHAEDLQKELGGGLDCEGKDMLTSVFLGWCIGAFISGATPVLLQSCT